MGAPLGQRHQDLDDVQREALGVVLHATRQRDHGELADLQCFQHARRVVGEEELTAVPLPVQVVREVDVADEIGLVESDDVAVAVGVHEVIPAPARTSRVPPASRARRRPARWTVRSAPGR